MSYQTLVKTKLTWEDKVQRFADQYGPFTTKCEDYRTFTLVEGFLEVRWPGVDRNRPPLIEVDEKPRCACCGSKRPMSLRYLTDRNGAKHLVGVECSRALNFRGQLKYLDLVMP